MSNIEKIKAEIERRITDNTFGAKLELIDLLAFIDSLPEEKTTCKTCGFYENNCPFIRGKLIPYPNKVCKDYTYSAMKEQEKPSDDLEEAAEEYADKHGFRVPYDGSNNYYDDVDVKASKEGFIAGAEWQKEQMISALKNDGELPSEFIDRFHEIDREAFQNGQKNMREQMMKGAVEGEIGYWNQRGLSIRLDQSLEKLGYGEDTEVKIIIVKK